MRLLVTHTRLGLALGLASRTFALLGTIGRRSDKPRRAPVGNDLLGNSSWLAYSSSEPAGQEAFPCQR
jgi:hypothetical protein